MSFHHSPQVVTDGLVLLLDAANPKSYPGTGTTWYDLSGNNYDFTLNSAATWNSSGYMNFESGIAKYLPGGTLTDLPFYSDETICIFSTIKAPDSDWKTLTRGASNDHQVIIKSSTGIDLGMYDNNSSTFLDSGFNVDTLPNRTTQFNYLAWKLSTTSPYYQFYYNNNLSTAVSTITNSSAAVSDGFASIGGYHASSSNPTVFSQEWGKISIFLFYNRHLSSSELIQNYNALRSRFGL